jgi:4-amino-4-deoxy-L-arabinose transferase-like glycosyltransferase
MGVSEMWRRRASWFGRLRLAALIAITGGWSWWLLRRDAAWLPGLRWTILALTVAATVSVVWWAARRHGAAVLVVGIVAALAGSAAYTLVTIGQPHSGGGPAVGPAASTHDRRRGEFGQNVDNAQLDAMLSTTHTDWSAAILRASTAAQLELSTHTAVMAIGGFSGTDPVPSLSQFQQYVADHRVTYYIAVHDEHDGEPGTPPRRQHTDIEDWVAAHYAPVKVGDVTVYNLTAQAK